MLGEIMRSWCELNFKLLSIILSKVYLIRWWQSKVSRSSDKPLILPFLFLDVIGLLYLLSWFIEGLDRMCSYLFTIILFGSISLFVGIRVQWPINEQEVMYQEEKKFDKSIERQETKNASPIPLHGRSCSFCVAMHFLQSRSNNF